MKRLFIFITPLLLLFAGCRKETVMVPVDESEWLYKEKAYVTFSDYRCDWYVVETRDGYSVLKSWDGSVPTEGAVLYGEFGAWGVKRIYNRTEQYIMSADVREYRLNYYDAMDEMNYQCSQ
jgi:hypothetical protein